MIWHIDLAVLDQGFTDLSYVKLIELLFISRHMTNVCLDLNSCLYISHASLELSVIHIDKPHREEMAAADMSIPICEPGRRGVSSITHRVWHAGFPTQESQPMRSVRSTTLPMSHTEVGAHTAY